MPRLLSEKLGYIRHQKGMTQGELAQKARLSSYDHIYRLEKDQRTPSLDLVVRLAAILNQSTDYFLRDTIAVDSMPPASITSLANEEDLSRVVGARLRVLRLQNGWGQTDLARKLGLKRRGYVSNLEAGRKMPSLDLIVRIADLFGVTTDYLLSDNEITVAASAPLNTSDSS